MGIGIFRRAFVLRRFGEEQTVDGYGRAPYTDQVVSLNVQPLSSDELQALPEGESRNKRMRAFGDTVLTPADRSAGTRGDWLFYQGNMDPVGHWYECVSSQGWDHTMLSHRSETARGAFAGQKAGTEVQHLSGCQKSQRARHQLWELLTPAAVGQNHDLRGGDVNYAKF